MLATNNHVKNHKTHRKKKLVLFCCSLLCNVLCYAWIYLRALLEELLRLRLSKRRHLVDET